MLHYIFTIFIIFLFFTFLYFFLYRIEVDEMVENQTQGHLNLMDSADKNCVIQ